MVSISPSPPKDKGVEMSLPDLFKEISRGDLKERRDLSIGPEMPEKVSRLCYSKISLGNGKAFEEIIQRTRNECGREEHLLTLIESFEELVVKKPNSGTERLHQKNCRKALMNLKSLHRLLYGKTSTQKAKVTEEETSLKQQRLNELLAKKKPVPRFKSHEGVPEDFLIPPELKGETTNIEEDDTSSETEIELSYSTSSSSSSLSPPHFKSYSPPFREDEIQNIFGEVSELPPFQTEIADEEIKVSGKFTNPDCEKAVKRNKTETDLEALQMRTTLEAYDRVASLLFRDSSESESNELALRERKVKVSEVLSVYYSSLLALHLPIGEVHKKRLCGVYQGKDLEKDMQLLRDKKFLDVLYAEDKGKNKQIRDLFFNLGDKMKFTLLSKIKEGEILEVDQHSDAKLWVIQGYKEIPQEVRDFISQMEEIEEFSGQGSRFPSKEDSLWDGIEGLLDKKVVQNMEDQAIRAENERINQEMAAEEKYSKLVQEGNYYLDFSSQLKKAIEMLEKEEGTRRRLNEGTIDTLKKTKEKLEKKGAEDKFKKREEKDQLKGREGQRKKRFYQDLDKWKSKSMEKNPMLRNQLIEMCFHLGGFDFVEKEKENL